jgi:rare lipoprotein A
VTNLTTERSVEVRINDRGPARRLGRLIDLSQASFAEIAELEEGLVQVRVRVIEEK